MSQNEQTRICPTSIADLSTLSCGDCAGWGDGRWRSRLALACTRVILTVLCAPCTRTIVPGENKNLSAGGC